MSSGIAMVIPDRYRIGLVMKLSRFVLPLLLAVLVGGMTPAKSQETNSLSAPVEMSLDALVAEALEKNPELRFYEAELTAAKAGRKSAGVLANPELSTTVGAKRVSGGGVQDEGVAWSISVMQTFDWPGRIGLRKAIANRDVELAELGLARFQAALAARVRLLGYGLFAAQEKALAAAEAAERFQALREVLVQREPAGLTPLLETRVIEATELTAQHTASEAEQTVNAALLELNQLRGAGSETRLAVAPSPLSFQPAPATSQLLAAARTNNFDLRVRSVELAQQGFRVDLAKRERFPSLAVGPTFSQERAGNEREQIIGVGISLPLPLWNRNSGNIDVARARQVQAQVSLAAVQREVERKVLEAALTYDAKVREMGKWRPDSVQHFRDAAELANRHYRLGAVPLTTYVELQEKYLEAVESLLETKQEALEAAQNLELLTGLTLSLVSTKTTEAK
jgi:outer membrane protein, heavy metal efflux system